MLILDLVAHFLDIVSSPLLFGVIFLLSCTSGSRNFVRGGSGAAGALLAILAIGSFEPTWVTGLQMMLGIAAGSLAAELWLSVILPAYFGLRAFLSVFFARRPPD